MWEAIIALLGVLGTALGAFAKRKAVVPLENKIEQLKLDKKELLDKYARALGRLKTLEKVVIEQRKKLYEKMDAGDLADNWNGMQWPDEDPEGSN